MQIVLQWEIDAFVNYINPQRKAANNPDGQFNIEWLLANGAPATAAALAINLAFTVNQIRETWGLPAHPDTSNGLTAPTAQCPFGDISQGVTANRGNALITATDNPQTSDATIPSVFKAAFSDITGW